MNKKHLPYKNIFIGAVLLLVLLIILGMSMSWYRLEFPARYQAELEGMEFSMNETHFTGLLENFIVVEKVPEDDTDFDEYIIQADVREVYRGNSVSSIVFTRVTEDGASPLFYDKEIVSLCVDINSEYVSAGVGSDFNARRSFVKHARHVSGQAFNSDQEEFAYCE